MDTIAETSTNDLWAPRRQATLAQARRRSGLVKLLRMLFVAGAAVAMGLFGGHIVKSVVTGNEIISTPIEDEIQTMMNPRFTGRDSAGTSYVIVADSARRRRADDGAVDLVAPILTDAMGGRVQAPTGFYDRDTGILELYEDVKIYDAGGYSFTTSSARIYVGDGRVEGLEPLSGSGPLGDIRSDAYEILEDGDHVIFKGNVQMTIYQDTITIETPEEGDGDEN